MRAMRTLRNVKLGVKNLLLHKLRSMLTMLGVVFGVGSVVAMLAVGEGASEEALEQIRKLGSNNIIISSQKPAEDQVAGAERVYMAIYGLEYRDQERIGDAVQSVLRTVPVKSMQVQGRQGSRAIDMRLVGTTPAWFDLVRREMLAGRPLRPVDLERKKNVVVLTEYGARRILATQGSIGEQVRIGGQYFEVVGIVRSETGGAGGLQTPDQRVDAYIPITVARERFGDVQTIRSSGSRIRERIELSQLIVEVDAVENVASAAAAIEAMLQRFHPKGDYRISVPYALILQTQATQRTFNIVLGSIAGISLLVGGIGIMNIMLASVTERTREIGVRRAIGAQRAQIVGQFLVETTVLSMIGGILGIVFGISIPYTITQFAGMPTVVTPFSLVLSVGISLLVGLVFGIYPAYRAANLDPIEALRHE